MIERIRQLNKLKPFIDKPVIKVVTGIRRCGKSTLLFQIMAYLEKIGVSKSQIIYVNKELMEFDFVSNFKELHQFIHAQKLKDQQRYYVFIDEVQEIEQWEKAVNSLLAEGDFDIYITGSNARLMSSEIATLLSGRYVEFKMHTLVYSEFREIMKQRKLGNESDWFSWFMKYGGFPGIHQMDWDESVIKQYLNSIYNTVLLKDVIVRNNIRDSAMLDTINKYLIDNVGNITSAKGISDYMKSQFRKVSVDTTLNYIQHSCDAMIFEKIKRFDLQGKRILETLEKYYMADVGFRFATMAYTPQALSGQLENIVLIELLARDYDVAIGKISDKEVDFIATKGSEKIYIQVCVTLADEKVIEREFGVFDKINDHFPKIVLSMDKGFETTKQGVQWQNVEDFLMRY